MTIIRLPQDKAIRWMIVLAVIVLGVALSCVLFFSSYYNYAAESISLASLIRVAAGQPYVGRLDELPLLWNPYSPFLAWLVTPVLRVFHFSALAPVALVARMTVLAVFACWVQQLAQFAHSRCPKSIEWQYLVVAVLWVMLLFTVNLVAVRPDLLSFFAEFLSLVAVLRSVRDNARDWRFVALAGVLAGLAAGVKLNTVGGAVGISMFLVWERRYSCVLIFGACAAVMVSAMLVLEYAVYGPVILEHVVFGLQSRAFHGIALARRSFGVLDEVFVLNVPFFLFSGWGLAHIGATDRRLSRCLACFIVGSLCVASLGQSKIGASSNYFIGAFMAGVIPLAVGVRALFAASASAPQVRAMRAVLYFTWTVLLLKAAVLPTTIVANDMRHYPYDAVRKLIRREYPRAVVYTPDENAALQFNEFAPLGPWSEGLLGLSDGFARYLPAIRQRLAGQPFTLAVTTGTACDTWRPGGVFERETSHLRKLAVKFDKICVYSALEPTPSRPVY